MKQTYQMYFGRNTKDGAYVTDTAWESFRELLSMSFDGYTIQDVEGSWKGSTEDTKLVTVTTKCKEKVNDLINAYTEIYNQDAVGLLVSNPMQFVKKQSEVY